MAAAVLRMIATIATLLVIFNDQVSASGVFELRLHEFINAEEEMCSSDRGCDTSSTQEPRACECRTFFRVCLKHYQTDVSPEPPCTYGAVTTPVLGTNSFRVQKSHDFSNPIQLPFNFTWPGTFSLIIEAWHANTSSASAAQATHLLSRLATQRRLAVGENWSQDVHIASRTELKYSYRVLCAEHYYGNGCTTICRPRHNLLGHYTCDNTGRRLCLPGWNGRYCDQPICLPGCEQGYCKKPGECTCRMGWDGPLCDRCRLYPGCLHATCEQPWDCNCKEGWGGLFCNLDLNYCTNHQPCVNGAICSNTGQGSYTCQCPPGFTGTDCEIEINECENGPCQHGGSCLDEVNGYLCKCPPGFYGQHCEHSAMTCADGPCFHGGQCHSGQHHTYSCVCPLGYTGLNCEKKVDRCNKYPCANGGKCLSLGIALKCHCLTGFLGPRCEFNADDCASQPCTNGGTCNDGTSTFSCSCLPGYTGSTCSQPLDLCISQQPCANAGTCMPALDGYRCRCPWGFGGKHCQLTVINYQTSQPVEVVMTKPLVSKPDRERQQGHVWLALMGSLGLLVLLLGLGAVVLVYVRLYRVQAAGWRGADSMNNCEYQREPPCRRISASQLKNNNKTAAFEGRDESRPNQWLRNLASEQGCKFGIDGDKAVLKTDSESSERQLQALPFTPQRDSVFHTIFLLPEKSDKHVLATEVSTTNDGIKCRNHVFWRLLHELELVKNKTKTHLPQNVD
uniref:Delta-like protein n=1 Tax=Eptatretus burgeri TaxID=7764 RepID=A0A8C4ND03_EPTBU